MNEERLRLGRASPCNFGKNAHEDFGVEKPAQVAMHKACP